MGQKSSISEENIAACREMFSYLDKILEDKEWLVEYVSYTVADISCVTTASSITVSCLIFIKTNITTFRESDDISPNVFSRF